MTEPKVGDRVRIVIEGDIDFTDGQRWMRMNGVYILPPGPRSSVVSIEVIPTPFVLPTKRWAQVIEAELFSNFGMLWTREYLDGQTDREWFNSCGSRISSELLMRNNAGLRVISEGVEDE